MKIVLCKLVSLYLWLQLYVNTMALEYRGLQHVKQKAKVYYLPYMEIV